VVVVVVTGGPMKNKDKDRRPSGHCRPVRVGVSPGTSSALSALRMAWGGMASQYI